MSASAIDAMTTTLHVTQADGDTERVVWLPEQPILKVGSHPSAHVRLRGADVARMHAVLERTGGEIMVIDLGSSAGTKINGTLRHRATVVPGDVLAFGSCRAVLDVPGWTPASLDRSADVQPAQVGRCPRCEAAMALLRAEPVGYRDVPMRYLRCDACGLSAVESATIEVRFRTARPLGESVATRRRAPAGELCPACLDDLDRVTLEWDGRWVAVEECPGCGCVLLDDGEGFTLDAMLAAIAR